MKLFFLHLTEYYIVVVECIADIVELVVVVEHIVVDIELVVELVVVDIELDVDHVVVVVENIYDNIDYDNYEIIYKINN